MEKKLIELHSIKAKLSLNFYLVVMVITIYNLVNVVNWKNVTEGNNFIFPFILIIVLGVFLGVYAYSYLGYLDKEANILFLRKPFWSKKKKIKFENISYIETTKLGVVVRSKHLKIVEKKNKVERTFYIMKGISLFGDDEKFLKNLVLKRKNELGLIKNLQ